MPPKFKKQSSSFVGDKDRSRVIYWFRTDLRIHDSPALQAALDLKPSVFIPIWTWDPHYVYRARVGPNRWKFLLESQQVLSDSLTSLNSKQKLHLIREAPQTVLPKLFKKWNVTHLVFEKDTDAYARDRDNAVSKLAEDAGVKVISVMGRTLFDPDELVKHNNNKPTMSMNQVVNASKKINGGRPAKPVSTPTSLPDPPPPKEMDLTKDKAFQHEVPSRTPDFNSVHRTADAEEKHYEPISGPNNDYAIVTLEEMGIDPSSAQSPHKGGEKEALSLLKKYIDDEEYTATFEKPKSSPADFEPQSTTLLSPHHHFGTLSIRKFWWDVQEVFEKRKKAGKKVAPEPANFPGQLLFRDMYFGAQAALGYSFAQTQGNPVAKFIDWHLQSNYTDKDTPLGEHLLDGTYNVDNEEAEVWFRRWKAGTTGFPWIDALMRQLRTEGWIHHLGRHSVACFLTRGGCYVSWERGAEVFEEWLLDHETACNVGNWMWLSCTAFFSQFYRCYSPISFGKKWDPEGRLVRKYVPELKDFDKKYIYEPWKAPIVDQKKWKCLINGDGGENEKDGMKVYPKPMFDFNEQRQFCLDKMKEAYDKGLHGDDEKVMNGQWKKIFDYHDGTTNKDEASGKVFGSKTNGIKRARSTDEHEDDHGEFADDGDMTGDEAPQPKRKVKKEDSGSVKSPKGKQGKLDGMVTREKKNK